MNLENETIDIKHSVLRSIFEPIGPFPFYGISVHGSLDSTSFPEGFIHARKFLKFIPTEDLILTPFIYVRLFDFL